MLGAFINGAGLFLAGLLGVALKKGIPQSMSDTLLKAMGTAILLIGLSGALSSLFVVEGNRLSTDGTMILVISLAVGGLLGEALDLDGRMTRLGKQIENRFHAEGVARGFIPMSVLACTGAMAIMGPLSEVLAGDYSVQLAKTGLDAVIGCLMAASLGIGVAFAGLSVFLYQGLFALLGMTIGSVMPEAMLSHLYLVGYALLVGMGFNFLCDSRIKTANLLPALLVPVCMDLLGMWNVF